MKSGNRTRKRTRLPLSEPRDSRSKGWCNVDRSVVVGLARSFSAACHGLFSARYGVTTGRPQRLLLTLRSRMRVGGELLTIAQLWEHRLI
jgi:hypothetical protein